ncbi:MAG: SPOR domain-containing protein [Peptostreptococcaceae bacterium]
MSLKENDNIKVPENLNDYIDKGIKKGMDYKGKNKNSSLIKAASAVLISGGIITSISNIPVLANELVKIPVIGELVKVLDFSKSTQLGGVITDGNKIVIDSLDKNNINIYFTDNGKLATNVPHYEVEYRQYPYTLVFKFSGVRYIDPTYIEHKVKQLPFVKDAYNIMVLDDSSYKVAIELNENIDFEISEYKDPGMIDIKVKQNSKNPTSKEAYFIRTENLEYGEQLAITEELLFGYDKLGVQKSSDDKYVVQLGPYKTEEEAKEELDKIIKDNKLGINLFLESRKPGEGPK